MKTPFQLFGNLHLLALLGSIITIVMIYFYAKKDKNKQHRQRDILIFTITFLLIETALISSKVIAKEWSIQYNLPFHLCDISAITILYALWSRSKIAFELGYFWGFCGGLMAMITPNIQFLDWYFVPFFVWHLFLIAAPIYQLLIDDFDMAYKSIYRALGVTVLLGGVMFGLNLLLDSNYMFVNEKIPAFDALGLPAFPNYLPYLLLMALALFHVAWLVSRVVRR